jgi:hypothetical protein
MNKEEVKAYYIEQLGGFFSNISGISDEDLRGLPAIHIPVLGYTDEMPKIAFYGMETNGWVSMLELRKRFNNSPSSAYDYITKDVFTPAFVKRSAQPRKNIFWKYVVSLMAKMYGMTPEQLKKEEELKNHSFIWGNIMAMERYHVSAKRNGVKWDIYKKAFDASTVFNTLPNGHWGPTYIVKSCRPKLMFILDWHFEFGKWLKNDFGIDMERVFRHLCYAHIEETDTYVFKLPHPVYINRRIGWNKSIEQVLARLELNNNSK